MTRDDELKDILARADNIASDSYIHSNPGYRLRSFGADVARYLRSTIVPAPPAGWKMVPVDDDKRPFADPTIPTEMVLAGAEAIDKSSMDLANYKAGETIDWDSGMIAVAVYRAMVAHAPSPPVGDGIRKALEAARPYVVWLASRSVTSERERTKALTVIAQIDAALQSGEAV